MTKDNATRYSFDPDYAVPPGQTLLEIVMHFGKSRAWLSVRLDLPRIVVDQIIAGEIPISENLAVGLESVTGVPQDFWLSLEENYRKQLDAHPCELCSDLNCEQCIIYEELEQARGH